MALPTTIVSTGARLHQTSGWHGPFISAAGNVYHAVNTLNTTYIDIAFYKATDVTSSFTKQTVWTLNTAIESYWCRQISDVVHVVVQEGAGTDGDVYYNSWNMADDTWSGVQTVKAHVATDDVDNFACSIAVRSDGDKIAFYQGTREVIKGTDYQRIAYSIHQGTAWTDVVAQLTPDASYGEEHMLQPVAVMGESDLCHVFFLNDTLFDAIHNTVSSTNVVGTAENVDANKRNMLYNGGNAVYYDDSGTERIAYSYRGASPSVGSLGLVVDNGTPTTVDVTDIDVAAVGDRAISSLAVAADGTLHYVYADATTSDLYRDEAASPWSTWGTDTEHLDAATIINVSCNTFTRSGTERLAIVYDNNGTITYDEYDLSAGVTHNAAIALNLSVTQTAASGIDRNAAVSPVLSVAQAAVSSVERPAAIALDPTVTFAGLGAAEKSAAAALDVSVALTGASAIDLQATAALDTSVNVAASSGIDLQSAVAMPSSITLAGASGIDRQATLALLTSITLAATGSTAAEHLAAVALILSVTLTVAPAIDLQSTIALTTSAVLAADPDMEYGAAVALATSITLTADGLVGGIQNAAIALNVAVSLAAGAAIDLPGTVAMPASVTLAALASRDVQAALALNTSISLIAASGIDLQSALATNLAVTLAASSALDIQVAMALATSIVLAATGSIAGIQNAAIALNVAATLTGSSSVDIAAAVALATSVTLGAQSEKEAVAAAAFSLSVALAADGQMTRDAAFAASLLTTLTVAPAIDLQSTVLLPVTIALTGLATRDAQAAAALLVAVSITLAAEIDGGNRFISLAGRWDTTINKKGRTDPTISKAARIDTTINKKGRWD